MEKRRKTLQELTFKDNFKFAAVMLDEENARGVIERALDIAVDHVEVSTEKSIVYNPEYKGVRLDVYLKDDKERHFNVEMQIANVEIFKRSRYYHSQIDMELLGTGIDYENLPDTYVIFICDFDPVGLKKYKYTRRQIIEEEPEYHYNDGSHTVFLSTAGQNEDDVSEELVKFLKYVGANLEESNKEYNDAFVQRLQKSVAKIKDDREMGRRYMLLEELMKDERNAGKAEGKAEDLEIVRNLLEETLDKKDFPISKNLREKILSVSEIALAMKMNVIIVSADSEEKICNLLKEIEF